MNRCTRNKDIRDEAARRRVYMYEIAQQMQISNSRFFTIMQKEPLPEERRAQILRAIDELSAKRG